MKSLILLFSLIGIALVTTTHASSPSYNEIVTSTPKVTCAEHKTVVKRSKEVIDELWGAFRNYTKLMRSPQKCVDKRATFDEWSLEMPWLYQSLIALFNAIYDQYGSPFRSLQEEDYPFEICEENEFVMKDARNVIKRLPETFKRHREVMKGGKTCEEKFKAIRGATAASPKLHRSLRAVYLAVSEYYKGTTTETIEIPMDYMDEPKYSKFEHLLNDKLLYTKVKA